MSDSNTDAGSRFASPAPASAKVVRPVTAERFAEVTAGLHRFIGRLVDFEPFQDAGIGIAEWSMLNELAKEGVTDKILQRNLGLTKQRFKQVRESLRKIGYIAEAASPDQKASIALTPLGSAQLEALNAKLTPLLARRLAGKEKSLDQVGKGVKLMMRVFSDPKPGRPGDDAAPAKPKP